MESSNWKQINISSNKKVFNNARFSDELISADMNILYLESEDLFYHPKNLSNLTAIPSYEKIRVFVIFCDGVDFSRSNARRNFFKILENSSIILLLIIFAMIILFLIRRRARLPLNGFISIYMDVMVATTSGGSLRYQHKWEKVFFGILLFAAFFINTINIDNFLFYTFLEGDTNRMDTFEKLAAFNPPVYISPGHFKEEKGTVHSMIR